MRKFFAGGLGFGIVFVLSGCTNSWFFEEKSIGSTKVLVTSADVRVITSRAIAKPADNKNLIPKNIVCAEPSPDIMKAVQTAFGTALNVGISNPAGISGQGGVAISRSYAESAAQLGERLATIQLLRDGLFRACEAYANGAISEVTYAVLLSRFDDTMITMLLGSELINL